MPLTSYFDASGHELDQTHLIVAGFVSSDDDWETFTSSWNDRLACDGVSYFHAYKFAHSLDQFESWKGDEPRRRRLCSDLMDIIVPNVYRKFSSGVSNPQLQRSLLKDAALTDRIRINAYALAGRTVVADVGRWMRENHWTGSPKCVFEAGDRGAGDLKSWLRHDGHLTPEFEGKDTAPLQAADWLAYESFQAIKNQAAIRAGAPQRWAFAQFDRRVIGDLRFYSPQNLLTLESNLENHASLLRYEFPSASEQLDSIE